MARVKGEIFETLVHRKRRAAAERDPEIETQRTPESRGAWKRPAQGAFLVVEMGWKWGGSLLRVRAVAKSRVKKGYYM